MVSVLDKLDTIPASVVIVGLIAAFLGIGWLISHGKKIWDISSAWYQRLKRKDELLQMVLDDHKRVIEYEKTRNDEHEKNGLIHEQLAISQTEMTNAITELTKSAEQRTEQINALMVACKELLASDLNEKYKRYIALEYIPEDEFDEFNNEYVAYRGCKGNSTIEKKYNYCIDHIPVKAVESHPELNLH